jgi:hypothetical protein
MRTNPDLTAMVVYESFFGNTEAIARAVTRGLELEGVMTTLVDARDAEEEDVDRFDLLVVGGPTHGFALSRPSSRADAVARGGSARFSSRGLREWLSTIPVRDGRHLAAVFDTRVNAVRHLPVSAATSAAHILKHRRFELLDKPAGFIVHDVEGPLESRQVAMAITWGRNLGALAQVRIAAEQLISRESGRSK